MFVWCVNGFGNLPALLSLVPTFALLFVVGWSLAICMGVANVMFQDSQHLIEVRHADPVLPDADHLPARSAAGKRAPVWRGSVNLNPLAVLLELIRQPLLEGQLPSWPAVRHGRRWPALAVGGVAALALRRFEKRMIFYL